MDGERLRIRTLSDEEIAERGFRKRGGAVISVLRDDGEEVIYLVPTRSLVEYASGATNPASGEDSGVDAKLGGGVTTEEA